MSPEGAIRINTPNVIGEEFDGEVVVVNLDSGCYFSLMGGAKDIWRILSLGSASRNSIVSSLTDTLDCSGMDVAAVVSTFLDELRELELVVVTEAAATNGTDTNQIAGLEHLQGSSLPRFQQPRIETFSDLQDILLLDPIHDVDEAGWPVAKPKHDTPR